MLEAIPGPWFLLIELVLLTAAIISARWWILADGTIGERLPEPDRLGAEALAVLREGALGLVQMIVYRLIKRGVLVGGETGPHPTLCAREEGRSAGDAVERDALRLAEEPIRTTTFMRVFRKSVVVAEAVEGIRRRLVHDRLLRTGEDRVIAVGKFLLCLGSALAVGAAKLQLGLAHDRPVGLLVMLLILAVVISLFVSGVLRRTTAAGRAMLRHAAIQFTPEHRPANCDPGLAMAALGPALLADATFNRFFPRAEGSGGSGSGCGGGGSDGDGGGGGCGGCGGGGGD